MIVCCTWLLLTPVLALNTHTVHLNQEASAVILEVDKVLTKPFLQVRTADSDFVTIDFELEHDTASAIFNFNPSDRLEFKTNFDLGLLSREYIAKPKPILLASNSFVLANGIITRSDWGANEALTYRSNQYANLSMSLYAKSLNDPEIDRVNLQENDRVLTWPQEYAKYIRGIVVHHTATTKDLDDPRVAVQNIYQYHTKHLKWGDIGYHYLIAPNGQIFEGRKGGKAVVAGHSKPVNKTTIGVALMGNYHDEAPSRIAVKQLSKLLAKLSREYGLEPESKFIYKQKVYPTIMAHRSNDSTVCPGDFLYAELPAIKKQVGQQQRPQNFATMPDFLPAIETRSKFVTHKLVLRNASKEVWNKDQTYIKNIATSQKHYLDKDLKRFKVAGIEIKAANLQPGFNQLEFEVFLNGKKQKQNLSQVFIYRVEPIQIKLKRIKDTIYLTSKSRKAISKQELSLIDQDGRPIPGSFNRKKLQKNTPLEYKIQDLEGLEAIHLVPNSALKIISNSLYIKPQKRAAQPAQPGNFEFSMNAKSQTISLELTNPLSENLNTKLLRASFLKKKSIQIQHHKRSSTVRPNQTFKLKLGVTLEQLRSEKFKLRLFYKGKSLYNKFVTVKLTNTSASQKQKQKVKTPSKTQVVQANLPQANAGSDNNIRVLLSKLDSDNIQLVNTQNSSLIIKGKHRADIPAQTQISVTKVGANLKVRFAKRSYIARSIKLESQGVFTISNYENRPGWNPSLNDNKFRNNLIFSLFNQRVEVVNELDIEDYLKGLGEVSNSDNEHKIKTIVVAARSYAYHYTHGHQKFKHSRYDLDDSPERSQKYLGYNLELRSPNLTRAIAQTRGELVTYQSQVVKVPYFNQSDGRTRSAQEVWGWKDTPYLVSRPDTHCKAGALNGHGVGISGCGATGMAKAGKQYKAIIQHFLPGVQIIKQY